MSLSKVTMTKPISVDVFRVLQVTSNGAFGCIAGSYALWLADNKAKWTPNDVDVFAYKQEYHDIMLGDLQEIGYKVIAMTDNSVTLKPELGHKVQLVYPKEGRTSTHELLERFDIGLSQFALLDVETLCASKRGRDDLAERQIRFYNSVDTVIDLSRLIKYSNKGYRYTLDVLLQVIGDENLKTKYDGIDRTFWSYP